VNEDDSPESDRPVDLRGGRTTHRLSVECERRSRRSGRHPREGPTTSAARPVIESLARYIVAFVLVGVVVLPRAAPVAASCDGPVPSFRAVVATARRVIVGDVVGVAPSALSAGRTDGRSARFTLRVRNVLRGEAPAVIEIRDLPTQPCASVVLARTADRIALAFDALDFEPPIHVNTAAWIRGTPFSGFETITLAQVLSLVSPPATATLAREPKDDESPLAAILIALVGMAAFLVAWRWFSRSRRSDDGLR
jgi:hypothetical protein